MSKNQYDKIDKLVQQKLQDFEVDFNEIDWEEMDKMLDNQLADGADDAHPVDQIVQDSMKGLELPFDEGNWAAMEAMLDQQPHSVDGLVQQKLKGHEVDFVEGHWKEMETMLDDRLPLYASLLNNRALRGILGVAALLFVCWGGWYLSDKAQLTDQSIQTPEANERIEKTLVDEKEPVELNGGEEAVEHANVEHLPSNEKIEFTKEEMTKLTAGVNTNELSEKTENTKNTRTDRSKEVKNTKASKGQSKNLSVQTAKTDLPGLKAETKEETYKAIQTKSLENVEQAVRKSEKATVYEYETVMETRTSETINPYETAYSTEPPIGTNALDAAESDASNQQKQNVLANVEGESSEMLEPSQGNDNAMDNLEGVDMEYLASNELLLELPSEQRFIPILPVSPKDYLPVEGKLRVGVASSFDLNYVDKLVDSKTSYTTGLMIELDSKPISIETGVYVSNKIFQSDDVENVPYIVGNILNSEAQYVTVEIPVLAKLQTRDDKRFRAHIFGGHSVYVPIKEKHFFVSDLDASNLSFSNSYDPVPNTANYESFSPDDEVFASTGSEIFDTRDGEFTQEDSNLSAFAETTGGTVAALPQEGRTKPFWGILNVGAGVSYKIGRKHKIALDAQYKTSLTELAYDMRVKNYEVTNFKHFKSLGLRVSWLYEL